MSSFKRRPRNTKIATNDGQGLTSSSSASIAVPLPGTKAYTSGTTLVSTGLRELDGILTSSGGQPLGSCIYLDLDRTVTSAKGLGDLIVSYWCAEVSKYSSCTSHCVLTSICQTGFNVLFYCLFS